MQHIEQKIDEIAKMGKELLRQKDRLQSELSKLDLKLSDVDHAIEFYNFNASDGFKIQALRKKILQERRSVKDELSSVTSIIDTFMIKDVDNRVKSIRGTIKKFQQPEIRNYSVRELTDLFGDKMSVSKKPKINL